MKEIFFATTNNGKQEEVGLLAQNFPEIRLSFPSAENKLDIVETGATFEENALLKARTYQQAMGNSAMYFAGDDTGLKIPVLNDEPGLFTRRWRDHEHEMTDQEIIDYCLERMQSLTGDERRAKFETVIAVVHGDDSPTYYRGELWGRIMERPDNKTIVKGFPFRSLFWVEDADCLLRDFDALPVSERPKTHREKAFIKLFETLG